MFRGYIPPPRESRCPEWVRAAHASEPLALVPLLFPQSARQDFVSRCFQRFLPRSVPASQSRDRLSPSQLAARAVLLLLPGSATPRAEYFPACAPPCACVGHRPPPPALQVHPLGRCSSILFASELRLPQFLPNRAELPAILALPIRARTPSSLRLSRVFVALALQSPPAWTPRQVPPGSCLAFRLSRLSAAQKPPAYPRRPSPLVFHLRYSLRKDSDTCPPVAGELSRRESRPTLAATLDSSRWPFFPLARA